MFLVSTTFYQHVVRLTPSLIMRVASEGATESRVQRDQLFYFETESETGIFRVSISRPGPRLKFSESQFRDRVRDSIFPSLSFETKPKTDIF